MSNGGHGDGRHGVTCLGVVVEEGCSGRRRWWLEASLGTEKEGSEQGDRDLDGRENKGGRKETSRFSRCSGERKGKPAVLGEEARGRGRKKKRNGGGEADLAGSDGGGIRGRVAKEEEDARAGCIWRERRARCRCSRLAAALRVPMRRGCREAHNLEEGAPLRVKRKARNRRYPGEIGRAHV